MVVLGTGTVVLDLYLSTIFGYWNLYHGHRGNFGHRSNGDCDATVFQWRVAKYLPQSTVYLYLHAKYWYLYWYW